MPDQPATPPSPLDRANDAPVEIPDLWHARDVDPNVGGPDFSRLAEAVQLLQDRFTGACLPADRTVEVAAQIERIAALLGEFQVEERRAPAGARSDLPGRGSALFPRFVVDQATDASVGGSVTFTRFHLGGNGAAHGGTLALLFDDVMGHLISTRGNGVSRTAYLHVNFRSVALLERPMRFDVTIDRVDGRKTWSTARITDGDQLVSDAEGLFIRLLPGQP